MSENRYPKNVNPDRCILVVGGPNLGFQFYGPFDTEDDAINYAETIEFDEIWWISHLNAVQCDEDGDWVVED